MVIDAPSQIKSYYSVRKPKDRLERMLDVHGPLAIHVILERYNETWSGNGITMSELGAILSRDKRFKKDGWLEIVGFTGQKCKSTVWTVGEII